MWSRMAVTFAGSGFNAWMPCNDTWTGPVWSDWRHRELCPRTSLITSGEEFAWHVSHVIRRNWNAMANSRARVVRGNKLCALIARYGFISIRKLHRWNWDVAQSSPTYLPDRSNKRDESSPVRQLSVQDFAVPEIPYAGPSAPEINQQLLPNEGLNALSNLTDLLNYPDPQVWFHSTAFALTTLVKADLKLITGCSLDLLWQQFHVLRPRLLHVGRHLFFQFPNYLYRLHDK